MRDCQHRHRRKSVRAFLVGIDLGHGILVVHSVRKFERSPNVRIRDSSTGFFQNCAGCHEDILLFCSLNGLGHNAYALAQKTAISLCNAGSAMNRLHQTIDSIGGQNSLPGFLRILRDTSNQRNSHRTDIAAANGEPFVEHGRVNIHGTGDTFIARSLREITDDHFDDRGKGLSPIFLAARLVHHRILVRQRPAQLVAKVNDFILAVTLGNHICYHFF